MVRPIGTLNLLVTAAELIIVMFFMRWISLRYPESPIGKALATLN